mgnify:FL=1
MRLNEVLSGLRNPEDILAKVCRTAFSDGQFQLVWAGVKDEGSDSIRVVCVEGAYPELADELNLNVRADDPGGKGPVGRAWREQKARRS